LSFIKVLTRVLKPVNSVKELIFMAIKALLGKTIYSLMALKAELR
jgi:hypothetical protein